LAGLGAREPETWELLAAELGGSRSVTFRGSGAGASALTLLDLACAARAVVAVAEAFTAAALGEPAAALRHARAVLDQVYCSQRSR
jgi:hypothetical protein